MSTQHWTAADIPDQAGRLAVITGANSGIGYEAARELARKGARVILAVRSQDKGRAAADTIRRELPSASVEVQVLDLSDLASVRRFAEALLAREPALPLLINNAGVMALPYRRTADGFEMQFGTNHLGHYALTGLLLPALLATPGARVVTVSSLYHAQGAIAFDNLDGARGYNRWATYAQSKLANLLFAYELQRRLAAAGSGLISVGCHPGYAATNLQSAGPQMEGSRLGQLIGRVANAIFAQSPAKGALPTLYAAVAPGVNGCDYIGPDGPLGARGNPVKIRSSPRSYDAETAKRLWEVSERLTGVVYQFEGVGKEK
ncbi:MAG TPA: oxidoreductase [Roseiflexaceae bacterium]|nr:oxidoreductase [Roseiflexaceae bacterium]